MKQQIKVPSVGESVTQATIGEWQKKTGDYVRQNDVLVVMETDKASMDLVAEHSGQLNILKQEGEDVKIGEVIAELDTSVPSPSAEKDDLKQSSPQNTTAPSQNSLNISSSAPQPSSIEEKKQNFPSDKALIADLLKRNKNPTFAPTEAPSGSTNTSMSQNLSPSVRKLITENNLNPARISGQGPKGRITKGDVLSFIEQGTSTVPSSNVTASPESAVGEKTRERMTTIRKRIAERLVQSQHSTATLTTFNEIDMSEVMNLRAQYKETFQKKHNVKLGFMGFFIKATIQALQTFPKVNAFIEGDDIVYNHSCHIGVAVSTDRGLVVPVIRNADQLGMPELERGVLFYAEKARDGKISPDDLMGGTFTISNGGVFGSLMSTPILNPPQSGILGMHKIEQRPIVVDGQIQIKPMMYVALSYDHRMVDGRESVGFLLKIKECVEDPIRLLMDV